jgi:hypothetical protein
MSEAAFFNEAAREAAVEAYNRAIEREPTRHVKSLNAALTAALEALPERSKAFLALAELSDEELVERVAMALSARHGSEVIWAQDREAAPDVLAALGLPVEQETTG